MIDRTMFMDESGRIQAALIRRQEVIAQGKKLLGIKETIVRHNPSRKIIAGRITRG